MPNLTKNPGVVVIITNETQSRFIVQEKDNTHPNVACRGCISLFGGSCELGEDSMSALQRELDEELQLKDISLTPTAWREFHLLGNQFKGSYDLEVFTCQISDKIFDEIVRQIKLPGVVLEGVGREIKREDLIFLFRDTNNFIASLDKVFKAYLEIS